MNKSYKQGQALFYLYQGKHCFPPTAELTDIISHLSIMCVLPKSSEISQEIIQIHIVFIN